MAHLQVFPLPSGNKEKQREKEKERGQEKRRPPLSQPSSALGECGPHYLHLLYTCTWELVLTLNT